VSARGLVVAAPRSGAGKTTVTLALALGLRRRGLTVAVAKAGPDYIDPGFHAAASGVACPNLDGWAMAPEQADQVLAAASATADIVLIESAMGLFDGVAAPPGRTGSAADLAARWRLPVLLVLDVSGQSQTAAAVARGLATHDSAVRVAGAILNRVGSDRHRQGIEQAMTLLPLPVLGCLHRNPVLALPERHLGLVQAGEQASLPALLDRLAKQAEEAFALDAIAALAAPIVLSPAQGPLLPPPGQRIALAQDQAFSFVYPHLLAGWREAGAELVPFSPLADEAPDAACDCCWLPGGYPELHAGALTSAARFCASLARFAQTRPVHGECGGHMVLGAGLEDAAGARHQMLGLLSHSTSFARRRLHLGYREARLLADGPLGKAGAVLRGHEFHYASTVDPGDDLPFALMTDAAGQELGPQGGRRGLATGSFFHAIATVPS
jgi:cobyrinic acid a,c-diamide synthase